AVRRLDGRMGEGRIAADREGIAVSHFASARGLPLSPTLPRKGGGSLTGVLTPRHPHHHSSYPASVRDAPADRFPPPLRGRVRERGTACSAASRSLHQRSLTRSDPARLPPAPIPAG